MGKKLVPIAWVVREDELIPVEWDDGSILEKIKAAIKLIELIEERRKLIGKLLDKLRKRYKQLEITF